MFSCQTFPFFPTFLCFFMFVCFLLLSCLLLLCGVIEARSVIIILKSHGLNDHTYYTQITTNFTFPPLHRRSWMVQRVVFQTHITCTCVCESFFHAHPLTRLNTDTDAVRQKISVTAVYQLLSSCWCVFTFWLIYLTSAICILRGEKRVCVHVRLCYSYGVIIIIT